MSTRTRHSSQPSLYYITFTCYQWLPLFELCNAYDVVYNWFDFIKTHYNVKTTAFVIMPNHVHCILFFPTDAYELNKLIGNGKRFMAYEIIKRLTEKQSTKILIQLKDGRSERDISKGQLHKVFEDSFDAKPIYHRKFLLQKINYIHLNPIRGKWKLVENWEDYEHSSSKFYEKNICDRFVPVHYEELT